MNKKIEQLRSFVLTAMAIPLVIGSMAVFSATPILIAQETRPAKDTPQKNVSSCMVCHACPLPTPGKPCLRPCRRSSGDLAKQVNKAFSQKQGPEMVILRELENLYLPVPFDHAGHAKMAGMTTGCAACHHYTPKGATHPACKSCHEISTGQADLFKPSLKGAYHRMCLNCHREWSNETNCSICHMPKTGANTARKKVVLTEDDIVGRMHPPIPEPDTELFKTARKSASGARTQVLFRHKEHIHRFGLACANCHHEDSCSRCHAKKPKGPAIPWTLERHHQPCAQCHDTRDRAQCSSCHWENGTPKPKPFSHDQTGWPLTRFHQDKPCRLCHVTVPFARLDARCDSCHSGWNPDTFNHTVTGQALDANHITADCEECHIGRKFEIAPTCSECHDEDEQITFPAKRPGPVITHAKPNRP